MILALGTREKLVILLSNPTDSEWELRGNGVIYVSNKWKTPFLAHIIIINTHFCMYHHYLLSQISQIRYCQLTLHIFQSSEFLYLTSIIDLHSHCIISQKIDEPPIARMFINILKKNSSIKKANAEF